MEFFKALEEKQSLELKFYFEYCCSHIIGGLLYEDYD